MGQVDLMATLADVVGAALPDDAAEDSFDLLPLWRGEATRAPDLLFDLRADPGERRDVAVEHPGVVAELQALLRREREQGHSAPRLAR